ncbi:DUF1737 domain-containing protein [Micromonospora phytophila]|uniref:DUF1737 domain-containing protein n=1 Tax=Micromonospora phytophila TaxID=709888 RepID=UPI0020306840|nr:DUF1737 domain-containing protein [Micromonospora phytophila]MCM0673754.1 DUF1737 domain-containing protein [Micromonospora phytophila]
MTDHDGVRLRYRLLTGPDDASFCRRVSEALAEGYRLHGSPAMTFDGQRVVVAQAVVLADDRPVEVIPV